MTLHVAMIAYTHYESDPRVRREAEALAERGDEVTVYSLSSDGSTVDREIGGVRVRPLRMPRYRGGSAVSYVRSYLRFFSLAALRLGRDSREGAFQVVHVHTMPDFLVFTALLPKIRGAKIVLDMHDLMPDLYALKFDLDREGGAVGLLKGVQRISAAFADRVICVHRPQYRLLVRDGVPAEKIGVVMNAADSRLFARREAEPPLENGRLKVVYHGTVLHRFGVDIAVRAFARARDADPRLFLSILGDGDFLPELRRLAGTLGLGPDDVHFAGRRLPLEEVAQEIRSAHVGLVPNRDEQEDSVLPTKLMEYVAVGIPAVATKTRTVAEYFGPEHAELVEVGDEEGFAQALLRLARDPKRRRARIEAGWAWDREHGFEMQKRALLRLYDELFAPS